MLYFWVRCKLCEEFMHKGKNIPGRHLLSCPIRMRLGAVPVSVAVPPMLAAYGMQIRKPFQIFIWYWASSRTSSAVRPSPGSVPSGLWRVGMPCFACLFVRFCSQATGWHLISSNGYGCVTVPHPSMHRICFSEGGDWMGCSFMLAGPERNHRARRREGIAKQLIRG